MKTKRRGGSAKALRNSVPEGLSPADADPARERLLFDALVPPGGEHCPVSALHDALRVAGLPIDDPRLRGTREALSLHAVSDSLDFEAFCSVLRPSALLIERAIQRSLVIPEFSTFESELREMFHDARTNASGAVADYIPQLGRVDPESYGVALCTTDGQTTSFGDAGKPFCVQSCCKPINYCAAVEATSVDWVHEHIGCEPSGQSFNELTLNPLGRPHNPMINAGAIMSCALIRPDLQAADRFDHVVSVWQRLAGGHRPSFSNSTYLSERRTADRNFALGYFMREKGAFPPGTDLTEVLEFYFQCCSLEMTCEAMAVVAATLANGGVCPRTGERVLESRTVQRCLSLMDSCGMYDYSGEWAFTVGLPAKSGVAGALLVVVPNVLGLCTWSPRLDRHGNSVRGIDLCRSLVRKYNFHNYDHLVGGVAGKRDPRRPADESQRDHLVDLCWAASEGDLAGVRQLVARGVDLDASDYDGRTALHLAASEGRPKVVEFLLGRGVQAAPVDRWGNTPLEDARRAGHEPVVSLLESAS